MEPERLLLEIIGIPSPSGREAELANYVSEVLQELNYDKVRIDEVGNVIGEIGSGSPTILLCGHLDHVIAGRNEEWNYNPLGEIDDKNHKIYGRGASDTKASVASMMLAGSQHDEKGKIIFAGVVEEESTARGVKHLIKTLNGVDYAVFGEPSGIRNITIGYRGWSNYLFSFETEGGHTGASWAYLNALDMADELLKELKSYTLQKTAPDHFRSLDCSQIWKKGGEKESWGVVPSEAEMGINFRIPPQITTDDLLNDVHGIVQSFEKENPKVEIKMKLEDAIEAYEADEQSIVVKAFSNAIDETLFKGQKKSKLIRKTGTGDMNIFAAQTGIPTITYGPKGSQDHIIDEYVNKVQYLRSIEIYQNAIKKIVGLSRK